MKRTLSLHKTTKKPFILFERKPRSNSSGLGIYYVQFRCENSKSNWTTAKSTGTSNYNEAMMTAWQWYSSGKIPDRVNAKKANNRSFQLETVLCALRDGSFKTEELRKIVEILDSVYGIKGGVIPNTAASMKVKTYMTDFWDFEKSAYLHEKKMSCKEFHKGHIIMMQMVIRKFWIPKFGEREIGSITKKELQEWLWELKDTKFDVGQKTVKMQHLSQSYINRILSAGIQALKYAYENKLISNNCFTGITYLKPNPKQKGILSLEQAEQLFKRDWGHTTSKLANQLAMLTGLRLGEILALKVKDLADDKIFVRHSFSVYDGLKSTKNGKERIVPASTVLIDSLKKQAITNPYGQGDEGYIFWSTTNPDKPFDKKIWGYELRKQLKEMGIDYKDISFHSWRHFFSTHIEPHLKQSDLQKVTGHLTNRMLKHYADHQTETAVSNVSKAVEEILLPLASLAS